MVLICSPDGTDVYGSRAGEFDGIGLLCKIVFLERTHFLFTCSLILSRIDHCNALQRIFKEFSLGNTTLRSLSRLVLFFPLPFSPSSYLLPSPTQIQLGGLGERCKLPQRGPGQSPGHRRISEALEPRKRIWRQQFLVTFVCRRSEISSVV